MKRILPLLVFVLLASDAKSQFGFPGMGFGDTASNPYNFDNGNDTPSTKPTVIVQTTENKPEKRDTVSEEAEIKVRRLNLEAQRIKLEREIAELNGRDKETLTAEEIELLRIKSQNLKLISMQEQLLLEEQYRELRNLTTKKNLPFSSIYGHQFFRDGSFKYFQKTSETVATENYVLGTGDMVQIEVWGYRYWSKSYQVSENGSIDIQGYQKVFVKGLTLKQTRSLIASRLGLSGDESSYNIGVTRPRLVTVNVLGEVFSPGTYTVPATNSAFNLLVSMGGPSDIGSVRNIYIKRDGKIRDSFDFYEYFTDVRHQRDVYLQNGDYIIVSPLANVISVDGAVRRPGRYELKNKETLTDLIRYAGGLVPGAYLKDVIITRIANNDYEVLSVNYDSLQKAKKDFKLNGGESVSFKFINPDNQYVVQISGAVSVPGSYRVKKGMRISSMIKTANGLSSDAYTERGFLLRTGKNLEKKYITFNPAEAISKPGTASDPEVEDRDTIYIYRLTELQKFRTVKITGSVRRPFERQYIAGLKLGEMLFMAGGLSEEADGKNGFIIRTDANYDKRLIPFNPEDIKPGSSWFDLEILPLDEITIYSKTAFKRNYTVSVTGPVKAPGTFSYSENIRVSDLISLSGGVETSVFKTRAIVVHTDLETGYQSLQTINLGEILENPSSSQNIELKRNDVLQLFSLTELKNDFTVSVYGPVKKEGEYVFANNMTLQNLIDAAGGFQYVSAGTTVEIVRHFFFQDGKYQFLKPQVIFTNISSSLNMDSQLVALKLQPFDRVFVRRNPNFVPLKTVYIDGAILYPGYYALQAENEKLSSVIKRSGGFRPDAMPSGSRLKRKRAGGDTVEIVVNTKKAINRKRSHYNYILKDGDRIVVPFSESIVYISGEVNKQTDRDLGVYYLRHKRAKYYIKYFAGGFTRTSDKGKVVVQHQNGTRVGTRNYVFFRAYPKVKPGSTIIVDNKIEAKTRVAKSRGNSGLNLDKTIDKTLYRATSLLSLLGIYRIAVGR